MAAVPVISRDGPQRMTFHLAKQRQATFFCGFLAALSDCRICGSEPVSLTARSAKRASSERFIFSVAGATGLPVDSLIALMISGLPMRLKELAAAAVNQSFMSRLSLVHHSDRGTQYASAVFEDDARPSSLTIARLERELSELLGRRADLRTAGELSSYFRSEVVSAALPQYERR